MSHVDPSGGEEIALVCPTCGQHRQHRCRIDGPALLPFSSGALVAVTYDASPGLEAGTFPAVVVRASGRVARVQFGYGGANRRLPIFIFRLLEHGLISITPFRAE